MSLNDPALFTKLERLRIPVRTARGHRPGETSIPRTSQAWGIEFEAYQNYTPGDDFRYMDWNASGRLDQLLVKKFTAEREISFHLFLDTSASMNAPEADGKFTFAADLVAALSYIILASNNAVRIAALSAPSVGLLPYRATPFLRHRSRFLAVSPFLASLSPVGKTYLREAILAYTCTTREPGVAIIVSDFLVEPSRSQEALRLLRARGYEVKALHVLGATELAPERWFRRGRLYDVEDQTERSITLTPANRRQYHEALLSHIDSLSEFCHRNEILYARVSTDRGVSQVVSDELLRARLVAMR